MRNFLQDLELLLVLYENIISSFLKNITISYSGILWHINLPYYKNLWLLNVVRNARKMDFLFYTFSMEIFMELLWKTFRDTAYRRNKSQRKNIAFYFL